MSKDKIQKHISLSSAACQILENMQEENGFTSMNQTIEYIIKDYSDKCNMAEAISEKVTESLYKILTRIRLGTNDADKNSQIILEVLNSIVYQFDVSPMTTELTETSTVTVAKETIKKRISKLKQRKDNQVNK